VPSRVDHTGCRALKHVISGRNPGLRRFMAAIVGRNPRARGGTSRGLNGRGELRFVQKRRLEQVRRFGEATERDVQFTGRCGVVAVLGQDPSHGHCLRLRVACEENVVVLIAGPRHMGRKDSGVRTTSTSLPRLLHSTG